MRAGYGRGVSLVFGPAIGIPMFLILANLLKLLEPIGWGIALVAGFSILYGVISVIGDIGKVPKAQRPNDKAKAAETNNRDYADTDLSDRITAADQSAGFDRRFALIDIDGQCRYAQIYKGTFQIGKARAATPTNLAVFARAILVDDKDGRFTRADKSQHGILKYGRQTARSYVLDPAIALKIGIPSRGSI
jgi:hypothetical protein